MACPKRVCKYKSDEERRNALAVQRKTYEKARIYIGSSIQEWDRQKHVCGRGHSDFAIHLLNLHRAFCPNFQDSQQEKSKKRKSSCSTASQQKSLFQSQNTSLDEPDKSVVHDEFVGETPDQKRRRRVEASPVLKGLDLRVPEIEGPATDCSPSVRPVKDCSPSVRPGKNCCQSVRPVKRESSIAAAQTGTPCMTESVQPLHLHPSAPHIITSENIPTQNGEPQTECMQVPTKPSKDGCLRRSGKTNPVHSSKNQNRLQKFLPHERRAVGGIPDGTTLHSPKHHVVTATSDLASQCVGLENTTSQTPQPGTVSPSPPPHQPHLVTTSQSPQLVPTSPSPQPHLVTSPSLPPHNKPTSITCRIVGNHTDHILKTSSDSGVTSQPAGLHNTTSLLTQLGLSSRPPPPLLVTSFSHSHGLHQPTPFVMRLLAARCHSVLTPSTVINQPALNMTQLHVINPTSLTSTPHIPPPSTPHTLPPSTPQQQPTTAPGPGTVQSAPLQSTPSCPLTPGTFPHHLHQRPPQRPTTVLGAHTVQSAVHQSTPTCTLTQGAGRPSVNPLVIAPVSSTSDDLGFSSPPAPHMSSSLKDADPILVSESSQSSSLIFLFKEEEEVQKEEVYEEEMEEEEEEMEVEAAGETIMTLDNASPTVDVHCCSRLEKNFQLRHHSQRSGVKTEKQTQYTSFVDCQICLNGYLSEIDLEKHLQTCHPQVFH